MIELDSNELIFQFPEVHPNAVCRIHFQRTLRIPDDNRSYPLPSGFGRFPMAHVDDHASRLPEAWARHGGVLLPIHQSEALWINFSATGSGGGNSAYPFAIKIAAGKVNAVTGEHWDGQQLKANEQNYVVAPEQPWLDGFCVREDLIRQFVAMPLGTGYTAEEQITGHGQYGGLQIMAFPMRKDCYMELAKKHRETCLDSSMNLYYLDIPDFLSDDKTEMGMAPGGLMHQEVYKDIHGIDVWDQRYTGRCFVHLLNSVQWQAATDQTAPGKPFSAHDYKQAGLPWFKYYDENYTSLKGSEALSNLDSVAALKVKHGELPLEDNDPVKPDYVLNLSTSSNHVDEGFW